MAERLKGLLDSARTKLGGLLGDFPQGFNAGAVAGVAGYPGDIAYMLDTAGRALTGQDTQPAAQDFPGTTEYIANKAGYPVPQSFSGQLGAAVGGVLTPGPGDLAKFAPVLSAIPFWHGSPHKYDAVDLSKIGTGEGAQAYGHGYYGADAENTARSYMQTERQNKRVTGGLNPAQEYISDMMDKGLDPTTIFSRATAEGRKFVGQAGESPYDAFMREYSTLADSDAQSHLYRGEYRWPDPTKEAATPLTGEDLLDWDKPLSEQSPQVQKALGFSTRPADEIHAEALQLMEEGNKRAGRAGGWQDYPELKARYDELNDELDRIAPNITGADYYRGSTPDDFLHTVLRNGNSDPEASAELLAKGIPGIRYLDQMSRGAGDGTRNYVMFDDKGIKLLERNGEQLGRQPITAYHKTDAEFDEFDPAFFGKNDNGYAGRGVYLTPKPLPGFTYGKDTLKVSAALENPYIRTKDSWNTDPLDPYTWIPKRTEELGGKPQDRTKASEEWTQMMRSKGHDGFIDEATDGGEIVVFDPKKAKILERNGEPLKAAEDFAARRAGKAKPYKEFASINSNSTMGRPRMSTTGNVDDFSEWFNGSKLTSEDGSPLTLKHGSRADFDEFRSTLGGIYLTEDGSAATAIFTKEGRGDVGEYNVKMTRPFDARWKSMGDAEKAELRAIINSVVDKEDIENAAAKLEVSVEDADPFEVFTDGEFFWGYGRKIQNAVMEEIKRRGYDGVIFPDAITFGEPHVSYVVFDPKQIRKAKPKE